MDFLTIDPARFRVTTLLKLGAEDIHELACKAVAVLTTYRLVVGRCLLALHKSKGYRTHGCASAVHYACAVLGMSAPSARECRRVARALQDLPELTLAAETGTVEWSKLREIVRRAVPATELYWLQLARKHSYREIEALVSRTPAGSVPGEVDLSGDSYRTELRCSASPKLFAMLDHARRVLSEQREEAMTTAQVLEAALATIMADRPFDSQTVEKARDCVDRDLLADKARLLPVVAEARELAVEMGLLVSEQDAEPNSEDPAIRELFGVAEASATPETLPVAESNDCSARSNSNDPTAGVANPSRLADSSEGATPTVRKNTDSAPALLELDPEVAALALGVTIADTGSGLQSKTPENVRPSLPEAGKNSDRAWQNRRLQFNPRSRSATPAQRRELLRRDGWACRTPGCPNKMWLHLHHRHQYSKGGGTTPDNLLCLCAGCHRNVHDGKLKITSAANGELLYTNAQGTRLDHQADLHLAAWLDYYLGWSGKELDSHQARQERGDWAVFAS